MDLTNEAELAQCFRSIDRAEVEAPSEGFPVQVAPVRTWSAGPRTYLLFVDRPGTRPRGVVFRRSTEPVPGVAAMCEWCHAVLDQGGVKLLTAAVSERRSVGVYLCAGLECVTGAPEQLRRISNLVARRLI
jgi:hypothetical protein